MLRLDFLTWCFPFPFFSQRQHELIVWPYKEGKLGHPETPHKLPKDHPAERLSFFIKAEKKIREGNLQKCDWLDKKANP